MSSLVWYILIIILILFYGPVFVTIIVMAWVLTFASFKSSFGSGVVVGVMSCIVIALFGLPFIAGYMTYPGANS